MTMGMLSDIEAEQGIIKKTCLLCIHQQVCSHYQANKTFLQNLPESQRPWGEGDIAMICKFFKMER